MILAGYHNTEIEDFTLFGLADVIVYAEITTYVFETKCENRKENSLDQCRDNYKPKFLHLKKPILFVWL